MPERIDRRIGHNRLLFGVVVIIFAIAAAAGIYIWSLMRSSSVPLNTVVPPQSVLDQPPRLDEPLTVVLYFPLDGMLASGSAAVKRQPDAQSQAREILTVMLGDQRAGQAALLKDVKLRELYLDASGTAYVDLATVQQKEIRASARDELTALYAVVNTLLQNIEEIKRVRVLLDGREAQTLAGHIDLSRVFSKRMDLVKQ
ncbi:MAG TPA: GerMN domain-containing protein [Nitrospirota bacterium]|nr:GerMN domain-containing protein [Nitrospirota bacterium]